MDETLYWEKAIDALGGPGAEGSIEVGLRKKRTNSVRVHDYDCDYMERLSDGPKSEWRKIKKDNVLWYARKAIDAAKTGQACCVEKGPGEASVICAILVLTGDFRYEDGQLLTYIKR